MSRVNGRRPPKRGGYPPKVVENGPANNYRRRPANPPWVFDRRVVAEALGLTGRGPVIETTATEKVVDQPGRPIVTQARMAGKTTALKQEVAALRMAGVRVMEL